MKFDLIDYKGKFTIIQDCDIYDDYYDIKVGEIDYENAILQAESRVERAMYYGVPAYVGRCEHVNDVYERFYEIYNSEIGLR